MNAQGLDQELLTLTSLSLSRSLFKVKIVPLPSRRRIYFFFLPDLKVQAPTEGALPGRWVTAPPSQGQHEAGGGGERCAGLSAAINRSSACTQHSTQLWAEPAGGQIPFLPPARMGEPRCCSEEQGKLPREHPPSRALSSWAPQMLSVLFAI